MASVAATMASSSLDSNAGQNAHGFDRGYARGPIVVLTYPHAGDELLTRLLSASGSVACTHGAGLLPLCHSAMITWQNLEHRESTVPSALAVKSVRTLVSTMAAAIRSETGATRWCETAYAGSNAAETFLRIYPQATFLCLHRSLPAVIAEAVSAYPWGLGSSPFWPYSVGHTGNNLATIAAYWAAYTRQLLEFEAAYSQSCMRIRHEDLLTEPHQLMLEIFARLELDTHDLMAQARDDSQTSIDTDRSSIPSGSLAPRPPLGQVPSQLLATVSELHMQLGYGSLQP